MALWLADLAALGAMWVGANSGWLSGNRGKFSDAAVIILAVCLVFLTRRLLLNFSAAHAGTVEITAHDVPGDALAAFREALIDVHLFSPSRVPGESTPRDFLSDVREAATAETGWGVAALTVAALFRVRAYKVSCAVLSDEPDGPKVLALETFSRVGKDVQVTTVSEPTWEGVARRAACHVAAYVLPRTLLSRNPPWTPWRRRQVKPDLFYHFQEARRLAKIGRLEESLSHFDQATALDPLNPYIRLEKATVLDELGCYVDALATYVDVVTAESWYDKKLWDRFRAFFGDETGWDIISRHLQRSPNGDAAIQLARYRIVCSLAASKRLAEQWYRHSASRAELASGKGSWSSLEQPQRAREAIRIIATIRPLLRPYLKELVEERGPTSEIEASEPLLRRILQFAALYEAQNLERDYRWYKRRRWHRKLLISQSAIRFLPIWAALQYRYIETFQSLPDASGNNAPAPPHVPNLPIRDVRRPLQLRRDGRLGPPEALTQQSRRFRHELRIGTWPPEVHLVRASIKWALGLRAARRGWLEHYNAACTYAVGMLTPEFYKASDGHMLFERDKLCRRSKQPGKARTGERPSKAGRHDELLGLAISQLSQAVTASDSQFAAGISPWLRRGDQDLNELRATEAYDTFVDRYLSPGASWPPVPPNIAALVMSAHVLQLVHRLSEARQDRWEEHTRSSKAVEWSHIAEEAKCWKELREYCLNYRDWRTRYHFILLARESSPPETGFDTSIPGVENDTGWQKKVQSAQAGTNRSLTHAERCLQRSQDLTHKAHDLIADRNKVLDDLAKCLGTPNCLGECLARIAHTGELSAIPLPAGTAPLLADTWRVVAFDTSLNNPAPQPSQHAGYVTKVRRHFSQHMNCNSHL